MKKIIKKFLVFIFARVFSCDIRMDNILSIRLMLRENLQLTEENINPVKLVLSEDLNIHSEHTKAIKLILKGVDCETLRFIDDLSSFDKAFIKSLNCDILSQLQRLAALNRLNDVRDMSEGIQLCYAQEGESKIIERFFNFRTSGFFVDVGAHDPKRFSNTYSFYKNGWRGINIDPTPGVAEKFNLIRPEDISLPLAISNIDGWQDFYMFSEPALNTFSDQLSREYQEQGSKLTEIRQIETRRLDTVLEQCHIDQPIDFMSIDVEGHELFVLQSNNWTRFRPKVLLLEILNFDMTKSESYPEHNFVINEGYVLFAKTFNTLIYKDCK